MAVSIRLRRMGRKKQPHYRVVVADKTSPRDGRFIETLGYYRPLTDPARLVLDLERVDHWIDRGARPSHTVRSLISKARKGGGAGVVVGEADLEAERARKAEALAARRTAEAAAAKKGEAADASAETPPAPKAAEAETEAPEAETEAPEAETEAPEAEGSGAETEAPRAEKESAAEKEAEEAPEEEAEEEPAAEAGEDSKKEG